MVKNKELFGKIISPLYTLVMSIIACAGSLDGIPKLFKSLNEVFPLVVWIAIVVLSFMITIIINFNIQLNFFTKNKKIRLVILYPKPKHDYSSSPALQDGERQQLGIARFRDLEDTDFTGKFNLIEIDHQMSGTKAVHEVEKQLKMGTRYFICTMSDVAVFLSSQWNELTKNFPVEQKPILICTIASAPIICSKNLIYRFYIRSDDEAAILAQVIEGKNKTILYIVVDDDYGNGALNTFRNHFADVNLRGLKISSNKSGEEVNKLVKNYIDQLESKLRIDAIFIAHYAGGLKNIINALEYIDKDILILATSTITVPDWRMDIDKILKEKKWITCFPEYKDNRKELYAIDIVREFVFYTIYRFTKSIIKTVNDSLSFDNAWRSTIIPDQFKNIKILDNGDSMIYMQSEKHLD